MLPLLKTVNKLIFLDIVKRFVVEIISKFKNLFLRPVYLTIN